MDSDESNQLRDAAISLRVPNDINISIKRVLGWGIFGQVMQVMLEPGPGASEMPTEAAATKLLVNKAKTKPTAVASWLDRETRIWSSFNHENILKFIGYHTEDDFTTVYLLAPYMRNGNARTYLEERQSTMEERFFLLRDTLMGLEYLHHLSPPVVHGNLKATNVLISDSGRAVLCDVGLYTLVNHVQLIGGSGLDGLVGRSGPESVSTSNRTTKSDIWAWGCLALEMMTGKIPYHYLEWLHQVKERVLSGQTPEPRTPPQNWPIGLLELVRKCWSQRPEDRPNVRMCVESVDRTLSMIERLRKDALELLGDSFIMGERLKPRRDQTLHEAQNRTTKKAELSPSGVVVVVKEINLREIQVFSSRVDLFNRFAQQTAVLSSLKHENILEFIGYSAKGYFETVALVTADMINGNLADYMNGSADINEKFRLARDTMNGLEYLHSREPPVTHGNITPFNVLINETGKAVLSDVGLAAIDWHPIRVASRPSGRWSSPEVNHGSRAVIQSDIWSWACVVLRVCPGNPKLPCNSLFATVCYKQLLTVGLPYSYIHDEDQVKAVMSPGKRGRLTPDAFHELDDLPDDLVQLLRRCWDFDLLRRPNVRECTSTLNSMLNTNSVGLDELEEQAEILSLDDDISRFITGVSPQAICINGRFGDVFKGTHRTLGEVALKRLRIGGAAVDDQVIRRFEREASTWRRLEHPNVLKFLGTYKREAHLYLVSPFMQNGTLLEYVHDRPSVSRIRLLCETSDAVGYLHRESIVHGDLKAGNLLISDDGHVLLCDFGLTKPTYAQTSTALKGAGTVRWQSPELWDNEPRTFASDVYAFSMTIVEVLTGLPPFPHLENEMAVMMAVYQRDVRPVKTPLEASGVSYDNAWKVAEACWPKIPGDRISMSEAFCLLRADPSLA